MFLKNIFVLDCAWFDVVSEDDEFFYVVPSKSYPVDRLSKKRWQRAEVNAI